MDNCIKFLYLLTAECNGRLNDPNSIFEVNYALNPQKLSEPFHTRKARNGEFQTMCFLS